MKKLILMLMLISLIIGISKNANAWTRKFDKTKLEEIAKTMGEQAGYKVIFAGKIPNRAKNWFCNGFNGSTTGFCNVKYYLDYHLAKKSYYTNRAYSFTKLSWKHALEKFLTRYDFTINFVGGKKIVCFYNPEHIFTDKWDNPNYTVKLAGSKLKKSDIINSFAPFILNNILTGKTGKKALMNWQWIKRNYKYNKDLDMLIFKGAFFLSVPKSALKGE